MRLKETIFFLVKSDAKSTVGHTVNKNTSPAELWGRLQAARELKRDTSQTNSEFLIGATGDGSWVFSKFASRAES